VPRPATHPVYQAFIQHPECILTSEHRASLRDQRGFTDEQIDRAQLKSARPENMAIIEAMQEAFDTETLIAAGILVVINGEPIANAQVLLQDGILIPYLNEQNQAFHLRKHKHGFRNVQVEMYFAGHSPHLIYTESEFKALASHAFGYPAIGVPGIASFSRTHFGRLSQHLREEHTNRVTIIYDNEVKDDPAFPNYKPDPSKRYDTEYYAVLMAQRIEDMVGIPTRIGRLPDAWRSEGKIDIDGALAAGHTSEEYAAVLANALTWGTYLNGLGEEAQRVVRRKLEAWHIGQIVRRDGGGYSVRSKKKGEEGMWTPVSNCQFDIVGRVRTTAGIIRRIQVREPSGRVSDPIEVTSDALVRVDRFQKALYDMGHGEGQFTGTPEDLMNIIRLEQTRAPDVLIEEVDHVGKVAGKDLWLFGNGMVHDGVFAPADDHGICWNSQTGFHAANCMGKTDENHLPHWQRRKPTPDWDGLDQLSPGFLKDIAHRVYRNFGGKNGGQQAMLALCWGLSCAYSHDVYDMLGAFPILYLVGAPQSGKSTMARWICRMYGITNQGFNVGEGTTVGAGRLLSYYSSIPAFLDECRERDISRTRKESLLRSVYDRQPSLRGTRSEGNEMRMTVIRAPAMISGEQASTDHALNTRCVFSEFSKDRPGWGSEYKWLTQQSRGLFRKVLPWILLHGPAANNFLESVEELYDSMKEHWDPRVALNYAVVCGAYYMLVDRDDEIKFLPWVREKCQVLNVEQVWDSPIEQFFQDLPRLERDEFIKKNEDYQVLGQSLYMNLRNCWHAWQAYQAKAGNRETIKANTALKWLRQTTYLESYSKMHRMSANAGMGKAQRCVVLSLDPKKGAPEPLISFADAEPGLYDGQEAP